MRNETLKKMHILRSRRTGGEPSSISLKLASFTQGLQQPVLGDGSTFVLMAQPSLSLKGQDGGGGGGSNHRGESSPLC